MNAMSIGLVGMASAVQRFDATALQTATGQGDPATQAAEAISAKTSFDASAQVVKTADRMMGSLLDIQA